MECEFCKDIFNSKGILKIHQRKAKYCLKIQNVKPDNNYKCNVCEKTFNVKSSLERHKTICKINPAKLNNEIEELKKTLQEQKEDTLKTRLEHKEDGLKKALDEIEELKDQLKVSQEKLKEIQEENVKHLQKENTENKKKIESMTKKYVKKQERVQFEVPNVIYVLTTACLKKDRRYILGKAGNLTDRLSTYNKTDEHEVVYYQGCGNADNMPLVESLVFHKLKEYREQANRERFVLPEGKEVDMFIDAIKSSVEACK